MGLFGIQSRKELHSEIDRLNEMLSPEQKEILDLQKEIEGLQAQREQIQRQLEQLNRDAEFQRNTIRQQKEQIVGLEYEIEMQDFGLYAPTYQFANSDMYKERLKEVRECQKQMIKDGTACTGNMGWTVNGNASQGKKMVKDMQKLLLRAFNVECGDIINQVTVNNAEKSRDRIWKSSEQISKLGTIMSIAITPAYIRSKLEELNLALDFAQKKQEEKDRLRELREQQKEEAKAQKEIEEARKKLEKERTHYERALETIRSQLMTDPSNPDLLAKQAELESELVETDKAITDVDYRQANTRAGYVYVISNIGAFGKDVYKIGMTRRLEPTERVDELGGASVPFCFDIHALIFTEDAPKLEAALHNAFEKQKVNKINGRREFFHVPLEEIKRVVRENYDKTVEWVDIPLAEQYRQSLLLDGGTPREIDRSVVPIQQPEKTAPVPVVSEPQVSEENVSADTVGKNVMSIASELFHNCRCQAEDTPDMLKIHIYLENGQKFGIVKIEKQSLSLQLRKLVGSPQNYTLSSEQDLKNYV